jgi:hypothetical protein
MRNPDVWGDWWGVVVVLHKWMTEPTYKEQTQNKGHSHAAATCGQGMQDATFYLIASQTIDSTADVVQLVVNRGAIMLGPAELNHICTCAFQP